MIYFLYGQDSYRSRLKLNEIIDGYKKVYKSGFNLIGIDAKETRFADFFSNFKITSMFAEKKLITLKNAFQCQKFQQEFFENIKKIDEIKDIVVIYEEGKVDERSGLFKALKKQAKCQEFGLLAGLPLRRWLQKEFENLGAKIEPEAENFLLYSAGNDLWRLKNEAKKLADFKRGKIIKKQDIELMVKPKIENDIFKTIDALASKNKKQALDFLHKHIDEGDNVLYLLSMIAYQFRNLLAIKDLMEKKIAYGTMAKKSGLHPFIIKKSYYLCAQFSMAELKKIYRKIFQADLNIKTGRVDPETALDLLVSEI